MKPGIPWSVKGIEPEARAAAKTAARQAGMTLGQWLNTVIKDAGDNDQHPAKGEVIDYPQASSEKKQDANADIVSELHTALSSMADKIQKTEKQQTSTLELIDSTITNVTERLEAVEENEDPNQSIQALHALQQAQEKLLERIENVERLAAESQNNRSEQGVDDALGKVVAHLETSERQSIGGMQTIQRAIGHLVDRMESIEQDKNTSAELISTALQHLNARIENGEERYEQDQAHLAATLSNLKDRIKAVEDQAQDASPDAIKPQLLSLISSIEAANKKSLSSPAQPFDGTLDRLSALEAKLESLTEPSPPPSKDSAIAQIEERLDRLAERLETLSELPNKTTQKVEAPEPAPVITEHTPEVEEVKPELRADDALELSLPAPAETADAPQPLSPSRDTDSETDKDEKPSLFEETQNRLQEMIQERRDRKAARKEALRDELEASFKAPVPEETDSKSKKKTRRGDQGGVEEEDTKHKNIVSRRSNIFDAMREEEANEDREGNRTWLIWIIIGSFAVMAVAATLLLRSDVTGVSSLTMPSPPVIDTPYPEDGASSEENNPDGVTTSTLDENTGSVASPIPTETKSNHAKLSNDVLPITQAAYGSDSALAAAAQKGDPNAQYLLGRNYMTGKGVARNLDKALEQFKLAAQQGLAPAQYIYGRHLDRGLGTIRDPKQALNWYEAAALQGHQKAMYNLAVLYAEGSGTEQDFFLAGTWFLKAAELGLTDAKFNLAVLFNQGLGLKEDPIEAYRWFQLASLDGDSEAQKYLDQLTERLNTDQLNEAKARANRWKALPLDQNVNFDAPN